MSRIPLRRRLFLLAAVGIVPLLFMSGLGLYALAREQRTQAGRIGLELARALATAVDAELRSSISVVQALATAMSLDHDDLAGFQVRAQRVVETQPSWAAVFLADAAGKRLLDTRFPRGIEPLPILERESFERAVRTRMPTVGNLAASPQGALLFPVRAAVLRNGELRYVLTALVKPEAILEVIKRQRLPDDWIISIFDANGRRVARSRAQGKPRGAGLGQPAGPHGTRSPGRGRPNL